MPCCTMLRSVLWLWRVRGILTWQQLGVPLCSTGDTYGRRWQFALHRDKVGQASDGWSRRSPRPAVGAALFSPSESFMREILQHHAALMDWVQKQVLSCALRRQECVSQPEEHRSEERERERERGTSVCTPQRHQEPGGRWRRSRSEEEEFSLVSSSGHRTIRRLWCGAEEGGMTAGWRIPKALKKERNSTRVHLCL